MTDTESGDGTKPPGPLPRVLVTGASVGIGRELARLAARDGNAVAVTARNEARLAELARELQADFGVPVTTIPLDLTAPEAAAKLFDELRGRDWLPLAALINNAGFGTYGPFHDTDLGATVKMLRLNVEVLTELTHWALPGMRERGSGRILNVASTAAFQPGPLMAGYYATKAYVLSFSEALAEELRGTGITVTTLCPGPTESEFQARAGMEGVRALQRIKKMPARPVAECGWRAMQRGKAIAVPGLMNRTVAIAVRWLPRGLVRKMVKKLQSPS